MAIGTVEGSFKKEKYRLATGITAAQGLITYDRDLPNNSEYAGIHLAVTLHTADNTIKLAGDNDPILGRLENVESDGWCQVAISGARLYFRSSGTITLGRGIVGAGSAAGNAAANPRGRVQTPAAPTGSTVNATFIRAIENQGKMRGQAVSDGTGVSGSDSNVAYVEVMLD